MPSPRILHASAIRAVASTIILAATAAANEGGVWQDEPSLDTARQECGVARVGDVVYVLGGLTGTPGDATATRTVEAFDLTLNEWSFVSDMPEPRDHMGCAALAGSIYIVGGYDVAAVPFADVFSYNPTLDLWSTGTSLPSPRGAGAMVATLDRLYHFGGVGPVAVTSTTYIFDAVLGWSEGTPMPTPREHLNAAVLDGLIYVIGGRSGPSTGTVERYDPNADAWEPLAAMPTARSAMSVAAFEGRIFCAGGEVPQLFAIQEVYDPASNTWDCVDPMPVPRHGVAAIALDDRILVPGGGVVQGFDPTNHVDSFDPPKVVPIDGHPAGVAPAASAMTLGTAWPNPFGSGTTIDFALDRPQEVTLAIYDTAGRHVRTVLEPTALGRGVHSVDWDGFGTGGESVGAGVYLYRLTGEARAATKRVIRLR